MVEAQLIAHYFPEIPADTIGTFLRLKPIYFELNEKVNLISRKDFDNFYTHHVLHSLALAKFCTFPDNVKVIDIGTGGGFPGVPLAIMFPRVQFILCDSIGKKIRAVQEVVDILELNNVTALNSRTENLHTKADIAVARAVAPMSHLWVWMKTLWAEKPCFYLLKGGDLQQEIQDLKLIAPRISVEESPISSVFSEPFFETKKVIRIQGK